MDDLDFKEKHYLIAECFSPQTNVAPPVLIHLWVPTRWPTDKRAIAINMLKKIEEEVLLGVTKPVFYDNLIKESSVSSNPEQN